jgi:membrane dipeptidase
MKTKRYKGYRSYSFLDAKVDYPVFDLVPDVERVPEHRVELSGEQEARAQRLLAESMVISLHDHSSVAPVDLAADLVAYRRAGRDWTGYQGLARSGLDAFFDGMMDGSNAIFSHSGWKWEDTIHDLGMRLCDIAHQDMVIVGSRIEDLRTAHDTGRIAFVPALEAATSIENEVDRLDVLYGLGIRCSGIAYAMSNSLGSGGREARDSGLTDLGRRAVKRMNKLGMAVDISHCGHQTSLDVIAASERPVLITHVGARALWDIPRLMTDDVFVACAAKGGVIGIEAAPLTTMTASHPTQTIDSVMEHFVYIAELVGIDHVAFGPDTNFGDHLGHLRLKRPHLFTPSASGNVDFDRMSYVAGAENPGEIYPNITRWLVKHGYSDGDIGKVLGGNVLHALAQIW